MIKDCIIKQPAGLGDIFFVPKILDHFSKICENVLYPVFNQYYWVKNYILYPENVKVIDSIWSDDFTKMISAEEGFKRQYITLFNSKIYDQVEGPDFLYVPLGNPDKNALGRNLVMIEKYTDLGLDWEDWEDYFLFNRNNKKEDELFYGVLGLNDSDEYILRNNNYLIFNSKKDIKVDTRMKIVEMEILDGFTLIDWCKVFENASEIHSVSTSIIFVLSKLKKENVYLYPRFGLNYDSKQIEFLTDKQRGWFWRNEIH